MNSWAPDLFYDNVTKEYVIVWSTAIPGRFPKTDALAQRTSRGRADHRLYYVTTKDFKTYAKAKLLYTCGRYGTVGTKDFAHRGAFSDSLKAPRGMRHGSAFTAPESVLRRLLALDSISR
ncbi:MAG: hypothetical protein IT356_05495 [Gemmatimonadaceae bacterium]|nr:hypothetical protein [Gemmatimonadaceae bacterium]